MTPPRRIRVSALALLLAVGAIIAGCSSDDDEPSEVQGPATTVTLLPPGAVGVLDLEAGQCFDGLTEGRSAAVTEADCESAHQGEVYATVALDDGPFPGRSALIEAGQAACEAEYAAYTGEPLEITTAAAFSELLPTRETWAEGDRLVVCVALGPEGGTLTGSIAGGEVA